MKPQIKKLTLMFFTLLALQVNLANAQHANNKPTADNDYTNAIGIRIGETSGLTLKRIFSSGNAVEGIISVWPYTFGLTGLYERYISTNTTGLNWYCGAGGHITAGISRGANYVYRGGDRYYTYRYNYPGMGIGIDGILGVEYKIPGAPLAVSFDFKPFVELNNASTIFIALDPGLGLKFAF